MDIIFYVSGHGFGHATRVNAIIEALFAAASGIEIAVRTRAPRLLFHPDVHYFAANVDAQVVESADALTVDMEATARRASAFLGDADAIVMAEAAWVHASGAWLVVTDIAPLAGEVAAMAGVPCVATSNFLWTWILERSADSATLDRMRRGYSLCTEALRLPFSHPDGWEMFPRVIDVPLVAPRSSRPREEIRRELGVNGSTLVLIGGRARLAPEHRIGGDREYAFVAPDSLPDFHDLVRAADIVVSKIGYSITAECIAEGVRLLYPPREGFREEAILRREAPQFIPTLAIPKEDWAGGKWGPYLRELASAPAPAGRLRPSGARVVANHLLRSR
jgi:L-arabinokinase